MKASLQGIGKFRTAFNAIRTRQTGAIKEAVKLSALSIEATAKQLCPVDTGRLRSSIHHEITAFGFNATVGTNVEYAPFIEFGTARQRAQPYLFPAAEAERTAFLRNIKAALSK